MASSKRLNPGNLLSHVRATLVRWIQPGHHVVVGLSGGMDSMALLDVLYRLRKPLKMELRAVHINHQISPHASEWVRFCRRECRRRNLPLQVRKVVLSARKKTGLEASARLARYAVYRRLEAGTIVLAHHLDDQAETLLLQMMRGAGVKGLSAMPTVRHESPNGRPLTYLRPLLDVPRQVLYRYALERRLDWIEDESNQDIRYDRNFLRHRLLPVLEERFPAYRTTLYRVSRHLAENQVLLDELAVQDGRGETADSLPVGALKALSPARGRNLLRFYLEQQGVTMPSAVKLDEILRQALHAARDARVRIPLVECTLRRFHDRLYLVREQKAPDTPLNIIWRGQSRLKVGALNGEMNFRRMSGKGIKAALLKSAHVTLCVRHGGERLRPDAARPRRSLKNLLRESGIPPWQRERLPLVYVGKDLVFVPGIGVDCAYQAARGEAGVLPVWKGSTASC